MRILKAKTREQSVRRGVIEPEEDAAQETASQATNLRQEAERESGSAGLTGTLANHKGKLAVGAAAMLGLAVFYKWRENKLAKDDPEEYARLRRLKAAVDTKER